MRHILLFCLLALALAAATGCRSSGKAPSTVSYDMSATAQKKLTKKQMHDAIYRACVARNWTPRDAGPDTIEAELTVRGKHHVVVSIPYTADHYDIRYKDSRNMNYRVNADGTYTIHPNYNKWVSTLNHDIRKQLTLSSI